MSQRLFGKTVDVILEDAESFMPASEALEQLSAAEQAVGEAAVKLRQEIDALNSQLALQIRRNSPSLGVSMGRDGHCVVGYGRGNKHLRMCADPSSGCFTCGDSPFERRFKRYHGHALDTDANVLGRAISDFFKQNYRSIR